MLANAHQRRPSRDLSGAPSPYLVPLDDADVARCGGKAANLARMMRLGLPVPAGVVVTTAAFEAFLDLGGLREAIAALLDGFERLDPAALRERSAHVRAMVERAPLPADVETALAEVSVTGPWAVRSSALGEDSAAFSFAGQLDSILGVAEPTALASALRRCWSSYWTPRCLSYQAQRHARLEGMGVIVQTQVDAQAAGVLFTVSPERGAEPALVLEYVRGSAERLVQGEVSPGRVSIERESLRWREVQAPEGEPGLPVDAPWVGALARAGLRLEAALGGPQDIEWLVDVSGRLHLVQTRAITTAPASPPPAVPRFVWSNANINENFPEPVVPLLASFATEGYTHYFRNLGKAFGIAERRLQAMDPALRDVVGVHGARLYYNLTNIHRVIRQAPFGAHLAHFFDQFVGASSTPAEPEAKTPLLSLEGARGAAEVARIGWCVARRFATIERGVRRFEARADAFAARTRPADLERLDLGALGERLRAFLDIRFHHWTDASLADTAAMISYGLLERELRAAFPREGRGALHNTLLKGLPGIVSSIPVVELWRLAEAIRATPALLACFQEPDDGAIVERLRADPAHAAFRARFDAYLDQWGFRCSGELLLTRPSFQERPEGLIAILKTYLQMDADSPAAVMARQNAERLAQTERVLTSLTPPVLARLAPWPNRARRVRWLLKMTAGAIALRERARLKQALLYTRLRRVVLAAGARLVERGLLEDPEGAFFLTYQELEALLAGRAPEPRRTAVLVAQRRAEHQRLGRCTPPDSFELAAGEAWSTSGKATSASEAASPTPEGLLGVAACGGKVSGRAAVLGDVTESHKLRAGDILVTRQTDPGWGPLFFLIRGLIIERGGMLSHGAIIAREFGIPALVGVPAATRRIPHGSTLHLDGDRGVATCDDILAG